MQEPSFEVGGLATAHRIHTLLLRSFGHSAKYFFRPGRKFFFASTIRIRTTCFYRR